MNLGLEEKRALVTAASAGLGFSVANALAAEGAVVSLCSRDADRANAAAEKLKASGKQDVYAFAADVSNEEDLHRLTSDAVGAMGGLDILVCNAGGPPSGGFSSLQESDWDKAYQLTLMSVVRSVQNAIPHLEKQGGRILLVASSSVKRPIPNLLLSNVFRPAVQALCKSLAIELAGRNIQVNCIAPGRIKTERTDELDNALARKQNTTFEEVRARSINQIPMQRLGTPEEFGKVAAFLCSDAASYVSGSTILVDGAAVTCL